jgi:hypothetical protein
MAEAIIMYILIPVSNERAGQAAALPGVMCFIGERYAAVF